MALPLIRVDLESIPSTNDWARDSVLGGTTLNYPLVVTARSQSAGRGRHGHSFYSPGGSGIYLSYAYERDYSEEDLLQVTTKVAQAILPVLQQHTKDELRIKPINDILKGPRKIAGILTERIDYPDRNARRLAGQLEYFIIIGIGINCTPCEVPEELEGIIGWLEPDCEIEQLKTELIEALFQLNWR